MRVLQVNVNDLIGSRFNNLAVRNELLAEGIDSRHLVWDKLGSDPSVSQMLPIPGLRRLTRKTSAFEKKISVQNLLYFSSFLLPMHSLFRKADVVHYHIIHDNYFSLLALPFLTALKPSVWTLHDPWAMTGRCIYQLGCDRWENGCGFCPTLQTTPFQMREDRTGFNFRMKRRVFNRSRIELILASQYMMDMASRSPIVRPKNRHHVPFGIDLKAYKPHPSMAARERLGVLPGRVVVGVRAHTGPFKGFALFLQALELLDPSIQLTIITTQSKGVLNKYIGRHQLIELGWINNDEMMIDSLNACDFFVMPSDAEAFGMMAIEAMACGKPIIVTSGTSLAEVTFAPDVGVVTPAGDAVALASAMTNLITNEEERNERGHKGRLIAEAHYDSRLFVKKLRDVYTTAIHRHSGK